MPINYVNLSIYISIRIKLMLHFWLSISLGERYYTGSLSVEAKELNNVKVELKNWHPATLGNVDGANNSNIGAVDPAMPDPPALV
jgi:hypothetical protein